MESNSGDASSPARSAPARAPKPDLTVRRVKSAYEQVADQLRSLVISGDLVPGDRLPSEAELMTMFSVSRSTVREALRTLSSQNLIATSRGVTGGSFVAWPSVGKFSDELEAKIGLLAGVNQISVDHLLQARAMLEVPAAALASATRTEEQLAELESCVARPGKEVSRDRHMHFHRAVLEAANNPLLTVMTIPVFRVLQLRILRDQAPPEFWVKVEVEHREMVDAITAGDGESASALMAAHLERLRETYIRIAR